MDLVTLIAACALSVEPKLMHALVWEQSGGEPWSFSVPGGRLPRVLPTIQDAIRATVEKGNAPNFDMPKDAYFDASDIASETPIPGPHAALTTSAPTPDDRARGWLSALFPARPAKPGNTSTDVQNGDETVEQR